MDNIKKKLEIFDSVFKPFRERLDKVQVFYDKLAYLNQKWEEEERMERKHRLWAQEDYRQLSESARQWIRENTVSGDKRNETIREMFDYEEREARADEASYIEDRYGDR